MTASSPAPRDDSGVREELHAKIRGLSDRALWPDVAIGGGWGFTVGAIGWVLIRAVPWWVLILGPVIGVAGLIGNLDAVRFRRYERRRIATILTHRAALDPTEGRR